GQAHGGIGGDAALAQHDLVDAARRHGHGTGQGVLADAERHQELLLQHLAGMDIGQGSHGPTPHSLAAVQRWRVWFQPPSTRLETKPPTQAWAKPALRASTGPRRRAEEHTPEL